MAASDSSRRVWAGAVTISGVTLRVYMLPDGMRAIVAEDIARLLRAWVGGAPVTPQEAEAAAWFLERTEPPAR
jgi:hypothetical protein